MMELLAPAGGWEAFKAAVENGADAVYLGGKSFSARAGAGNFTEEELIDAVRYAHDRQVRVFVAVNILVADQELGQLTDYIYQLHQMGVDAVILQDTGVAAFIQEVLPEMETHASTQMTVNNSWGVKALEDLGFRRVVLARETSAGEISSIARQTAMEIEVFVHGALCICYSGQCLMSSLIGGRSGNRGRCAQPCRMSYQLVGEGGRIIPAGKGGDHLLSPRDLNLIDHLDRLAEAGVRSLKIEGRMKRPEYVATVTRIYRKALDHLVSTHLESGEVSDIPAGDRYELTQIFNRDFTAGYLFSHPGAELMSYARPNNRGTRLGRVISWDRGRLELKLEGNVHRGDGIEVWTSRGREGTTIDKLWLEGHLVEEASPLQTVQIEFTGQVRPGDRIFKTYDAVLMEKARLSFQAGKERRKRPLVMRLSGRTGEKLMLEGYSEGLSARVESETPAQTALKRPLSEEYCQDHLGRLGNTPFQLLDFSFDLKGELMIPVRELNEMRRSLVEKLLTGGAGVAPVSRLEYVHRVEERENKLKREKGARTGGSPDLTAAVSNFACLEGALKGGVTRVLLGGEHWRSRPGLGQEDLAKSLKLCKARRVEAVWRLPRILNQKQAEAMYRRLSQWMEKDERPAIMVANLGELEMIQSLDRTWPFEVDYSLNSFNWFTLEYFLCRGARRVALSPELNYEQLKILGQWPKTEILVFGDLEMMVSEHCPIGAALGGSNGGTGCAAGEQDNSEGCTRPCIRNPHYLRDRMNYDFPIETDMECRMHLYNAKCLNLFSELDKLMDLGVSSLRLQMDRANPEQIRQVTDFFKRGMENRLMEIQGLVRPIRNSRQETGEKGQEMAPLERLFPAGFTKGHFFRGVLDQEEN